MKVLKDLFEHQLKDLYSAETQLIEALPKMIESATDDKLKKSFESHLLETKNQKKRLTEICDDLGISPSGEQCKAMAGLIAEADSFIKKDTDEDVKNVGLIAEAQRIEHYEISGYGTAVRYAKELGYDAIADKLRKTLDEEYNCNEKLNEMAENRLNQKALAES